MAGKFCHLCTIVSRSFFLLARIPKITCFFNPVIGGRKQAIIFNIFSMNMCRWMRLGPRKTLPGCCPSWPAVIVAKHFPGRAPWTSTWSPTAPARAGRRCRTPPSRTSSMPLLMGKWPRGYQIFTQPKVLESIIPINPPPTLMLGLIFAI